MNLAPPILASKTSLNERNLPAYSTRVNLYIVDGSIRKVAASGVIVRLQIKHIYVRTIYVTAFLLPESAYDETEIVILPKRGAASMEHARGVPKSQLLLMKSAYRMRCITKRTPPKLEFTVVDMIYNAIINNSI